MAVSYPTPSMGLIIPVPTEQPGPNWTYDLNASLTIVDAHNHSPGSGVQIPTSGIMINGDLSWNGAYNAVGLRSTRYTVNPAALNLPADISCSYSAGDDGDLYWNDLNGNQIRITAAGAVTGAAGTITGLPSGTASAAFVSASGSFVFNQSTLTAANLDVGSVAIRYPGSYPTPAGNYIQLQAPAALASGYALTLPALPGQTNVMTLTNTGVISSTTFDGVAAGMTSVGANAILGIATVVPTGFAQLVGQAMTLVGANAITLAASRTIGTAVNNFFVSSTINFSTTSSSYVDVTNGVVVGSFTGRKPVYVALQSTAVSGTVNSSTSSGFIRVLRNSAITVYETQLNANIIFPCSMISFIDYGIIGGASTIYSYTVQVYNVSSAGAVGVANSVLVAYEIT